MPSFESKAVSENNQSYDKDDAKRKLILSLESIRGSSSGAAHATADCACASPELVEEEADHRQDSDQRVLKDRIDSLVRELKAAKATNNLLVIEVERLEEKALSAIAEAGQLRHEIHQWKEKFEECRFNQSFYASSDDHMLDAPTENTNRLLTKALSDSESEIARLGKTIDLLVRRLSVA